MRVINVHEAKTHLSRLLDDVKAGEEIILAKMGKPYARLVPMEIQGEVPMGFLQGTVGPEFFEPMSDEELAEWERELPFLIQVLLDTHVLLWAWMEPHKLSAHASSILKDPSNRRIVSAVTAYEIAYKYRIGKLKVPSTLVQNYHEHLSRFKAEEISVTSRHGLVAALFTANHKDPFDRLLAGQSQVEGLLFLTADPAFAQFSIQTTW